jgi:hypothetical protein
MVVTGATDPPTLEILRQSGHRWLTKPIDAEHLQRSASELLTGTPSPLPARQSFELT